MLQSRTILSRKGLSRKMLTVSRSIQALSIALLAACANMAPLQADHKALVDDLQKAQAMKWAMECAPRELALADAHREFAELEFAQGDARRASEHVSVARQNIQIVLDKASACTPKDRDNDGIPDDKDACPDVAEDFDGFGDTDGCPDFDRDQDGISDDKDSCPDEPEDVDGFSDIDGCPDYDNDSDGIVDAADACIDLAEDLDGDNDTDGCPEEATDKDGDGIPDNIDKCPQEPENKNQYLDEDGCADERPSQVRVTREQIEITEKIQFEVNAARILPVSYGILNQVAQVMKDYPQIKIRIEGHTDSDGSDSYNLRLSQQRAEAVWVYISSQGVDSARMEPVGYGETKPLDTNRTNDGKATNRRVEFHITQGM
jgi:outer membrane protein OmpA-like peptidoglycan-associated protein